MTTKGDPSSVGAEGGVPKVGREALSPPTVMTGTGGMGGNTSVVGTRVGSQLGRASSGSGMGEASISSLVGRVAPVVVTSTSTGSPAAAPPSSISIASRSTFISSSSSSSSSSSDCFLAPSVVQRLGREIQELVRSPPEGITFVPNDMDSLAEIHADISGPVGTPYEGGAFRMKLVLSRDYPASPPRAYFLTKVFHPNIASNGDICVNMLKRDWSPDLKLADTLLVIRCLLIVPFPESSLNDEAAKLFMESYEEYARRARLMTRVHAWAHHVGGAAAGDGKVGASASPKAGASPKAKNATSDENGAPATNSSTSSKTSSQQRDKNKETRKKGLKRL